MVGALSHSSSIVQRSAETAFPVHSSFGTGVHNFAQCDIKSVLKKNVMRCRSGSSVRLHTSLETSWSRTRSGTLLFAPSS